MSKFTWLGDSDPNAQDVSMFGHTFVKGEPVNVTDKDAAAKLANNPMFTTEKADPTPAEEPDADTLAARAEEGTVKGALKARLKDLGVTVQGNPSEDTLRNKLVEATK